MKSFARSRSSIVGFAERAAAIACLLSLAAPATGREDGRQRAQQLFARAAQHYELGEYADALDDFKESYRLVPDSALLFNIAQCYRLLGQTANAISEFKLYVYKAPDGAPRADVSAIIARLERDLAERSQARTRHDGETAPTLVIALEPMPPAVDVWLDGERVSTAALAAPRLVEPGAHQVRVVAAGYDDFAWKGMVAPGEHKTLVVTPQPRRSPRRLPRWSIWTTGAVGVAALGCGVGLAVRAKAVSDAERSKDPYLRDPAAPSQIRALSAAADALLVSGAALTLGAGVMATVTRWKRAGHEYALVPSLGPATVGVALAGGF